MKMKIYAALLIASLAVLGCASEPAHPVRTGAPGQSGHDSPAPAVEVTDFTTIVPLKHAHAHNDYLHEHPLYDALSNGFNSVEADVWLVDGKLLVAHNRFALRPERSLRSLYLDPLKRIVEDGGGGVYGPGTRITLLVDVKSEADTTYHELERVLAGYHSMLSSYRGAVERTGAVTVVVSGNRDLSLMKAEPLRYAAYDGRMSDLDGGEPATLIPLISDRWNSFFSWNGAGAMPPEQLSRLETIVSKAHAAGRKVRFWGTPDRPTSDRDRFWRTLLDAGVDYLNTDDLSGLRSFLLRAGQ